MVCDTHGRGNFFSASLWFFCADLQFGFSDLWMWTDPISPGWFWSLDIITVELFYSLSSSPTHAAVFCDKRGLRHSGHCLISSSGYMRKDVCVQKVEYIYKMWSHALSSSGSVCTAEQHTFYYSQGCGITVFNSIIIIKALFSESLF